MNLRKQPGCWLRSSHTFKECVIAHWSSEFARKITGAKLYTEIADTEVRNQRSEVRKREEMIKNYEDLEIYQEGYKLLIEIYKITQEYPKEEIYVMTSQIRRASLSIILNIVEGYGRQSKEDFKRFLRISYGSINEVETLLKLGKEIGYIKEERYKEVIERYHILGKKTYKLIERWK